MPDQTERSVFLEPAFDFFDHIFFFKEAIVVIRALILIDIGQQAFFHIFLVVPHICQAQIDKQERSFCQPFLFQDRYNCLMIDRCIQSCKDKARRQDRHRSNLSKGLPISSEKEHSPKGNHDNNRRWTDQHGYAR